MADPLIAIVGRIDSSGQLRNIAVDQRGSRVSHIFATGSGYRLGILMFRGLIGADRNPGKLSIICNSLVLLKRD